MKCDYNTHAKQVDNPTKAHLVFEPILIFLKVTGQNNPEHGSHRNDDARKQGVCK